MGRYYPDGAVVTNEDVELGAEPDATFVSKDAVRTGRVQLVEGAKGGFVELQGSPDIVLEDVRESSEEKDTVTLRDLYWRAGIREYWLVDARGDDIQFDILRCTSKGYVATRKFAGWVKSAVLGKSFRLTLDTEDEQDYKLDMK